MKTAKNLVIQHDILRYKKNKFASSLALLGLACGCGYFIVLYAQVKNNDYYYNWSIAFDVVYNLFFLLFVFLFSEQVKNYNRKMFPMQIIIGVLQIARIFWLPLGGLTYTYEIGGVTYGGLGWGSFLAMTIFLAASGAFIIASAVIGFIRSKNVENFNKKLESGEIDLEAELKKEHGSAELVEETAGGEANA